MESYSLGELDIKMLQYINYTDGFFIECGANDGVSQSNTLLFEKQFNWKGLLVEPNPYNYEKCKLNRNVIVENYALVSSKYKEKTIEGYFTNSNETAGGLMSQVKQLPDYLLYENIFNETSSISVPCITLNALIQKHNITSIDFFSLDVEGYELEVLDGLCFDNIRPKYILIETANRPYYQEIIRNYMKDKNYNFLIQLSGNDDLFVDNNITLNV